MPPQKKPKKNPPKQTKTIILLRENKNILLARSFKSLRAKPSDPERLDELLARLRISFNAPEACWETMTQAKYEKTFPIINRLVAESFEFEDAVEFFNLFKK